MSELIKMSLSDITTSIFDGKHGDCTNQEGSGLYFISVKDLREYDIDYTDAREITPTDFQQNYSRTNLENGDTIYANTGDTIGKSLFVKDNPLVSKTSFQKSVAILKPNISVIEPRYLYYLLKYETPRLRKASSGSGQKNLLLSTMRSFEVSVHDRLTQKRIVAVLGAIDDKIRNNIHINDNLSYQSDMVALPFISIGRSQSRRAVSFAVSEELLFISAKSGFIALVKLLLTCNSGTIILVSSKVFMRMPLKILPVEVFVAFCMKLSLWKKRYKYSGVILSVLLLIENTDSFISQSVGSC